MKPVLFIADWGTFLVLTYLIQKWTLPPQTWWLLGLILVNNLAALFRGRALSRE